MRGEEQSHDGTRYYYQYRENGTKYYYKKKDPGVIETQFKRPKAPPKPKPYERPREYRDEYFVPPKQKPYREEYFVPPKRTLRDLFLTLPTGIQRLITTWLLIMGFPDINAISVDAVQKSFRKLSLIHHPDRGGSEESYKELNSVRDHMLTLCEMASAQ